MSFSSSATSLLFDFLRSSYRENKGAIKWQLNEGANPNTVHPNYGISAMHLASGQGEEPTQILLWHGGDPNVVSLDGLTPLHVAASWGDCKTLQLLLKNGADIGVQDQDGKTAYDLAVEEQNTECAELLKHHAVKKTWTDYRTSSRHFDTKRSSTTNRTTCLSSVHAEDNHMTCHTSRNELAVSPQRHLDTITEHIYKYLGEGKQVCFDATSPDTPTLGIKTTGTPYTDNLDCVHHEHKGSHYRDHRLQNRGMTNLPLSPESPSRSHRNNYRRCMNFGHDYSNSCNAVPNNIDTLKSHHHHQCQVFGRGSSDQLHCACISPQANRNIHNQLFNCVTPPVFCRNCREPSCAQFCNQQKYYSRCISPTCNCTSQFVTSPGGLNSTSTICRTKESATCLPVFGKDYTQLSAGIHSPERTYIPTPTSKSKNCSIGDLKVKSPVLQHFKNPYACTSTKEVRKQTDSPYLNECGLPLAGSYVQETINTLSCSSNGILQSAYEKQGVEDTTHFNSELSEVLSEHSRASSESDYFKTITSELHDSFSKVLQAEIITPLENCKRNVIKSDQVSGTKFTAGKLFPPLQIGCGEISCTDGNRNERDNSTTNIKIGCGETSCTDGNKNEKDNSTTNIKKNMKKLKRRSLLKPQETVALLPKSQMHPHERVAEFILSVQKFMAKSNFEDTDDGLAGRFSPHVTGSKESKRVSDWQEHNSLCHTEQTLVEHHSIPEEKTCATLNSSVETFATCDEGYSDAMTHNNELHETEKKSVQIISAKDLKEAERITTCVRNENKTIKEGSSSKWKSPTLVLPDDDIMTSDDSFIRNTHHKVYQMKFKPKLTGLCDGARPKEKQNHSVSKIPLLSEQTVKRDGPVEIFPVKKRVSSDSLFSTVSVKEYIYRDKETNITFIERHIPSDCGSSIARRSLDSTTSRETMDSQATIIYDWHARSEVLKSEQVKTQPHFFRVPHNNHSTNARHASVHGGIAGPELISGLQNRSNESSLENIQHSNESTIDEVDEPSAEIVIPAHLKRMTCQEISQELQKYGEIPGPVIPATRQVYLRRLTTLESNPGLVILSKTCPDYSCEMRQALDGQFDTSGLSELESKMIEVFSVSKNGSQWREGTVKSSFTYLLLDPRITDNLPLRAKNMSDLEVFKTFVCSIFYIGKGKRSRPYCHLYDAVSKMNKGAKMSAKEKQIVDIWMAGLGVVSLHCFQSVIPVEAYTREACMIQAIGVHKLTNMKHGDFYGATSSWTVIQRRKLGVYLLKKALQIFLAEGERQICLPDLKGS